MILNALLVSVMCCQQTPVFRIDVDAVQLDVFVAKDGNALLDLTVEDFEVYDSGVRQEIRLVEPEAVPLSTVLVFDTSESVRGEKHHHLKAAARAFLDGLNENDRAALLTLSTCLQLGGGLDGDVSAVVEALALTEAFGMTALYDGLYAGLRIIDEEERPLLLLFTDGRDTSSWLSDVEVLEFMRESNAVVYAVTTQSPPPDEGPDRANIMAQNMKSGLVSRRKGTVAPEIQFLEELARLTGGGLLYTESPSLLQEAFQQVLSEVKTRYLLSYFPTGVDREGWHELEVKVKKSGAEVKTRPGYWKGSSSPRP